jgi:hypothetical protein
MSAPTKRPPLTLAPIPYYDNAQRVMRGTERVGDLWRDRDGRFHLWHYEASALSPEGAWRIIGVNSSGDIMDAALELEAHHCAMLAAADAGYEAALDGELP